MNQVQNVSYVTGHCINTATGTMDRRVFFRDFICEYSKCSSSLRNDLGNDLGKKSRLGNQKSGTFFIDNIKGDQFSLFHLIL
ncbi:hypothetical protein RclHR1_01960027 [Rhizophagus clarus]|uniref:Uncharacterized protein n=1 Tax=Rhizophagus clarus TaxID=94130 RepID=A0A2Z6QPV9_9GLOM|nr:hypothetical protein RclHR1_01960027 [Rhizophagus clarus]GES78524.1 hypothetical protein RCL_e6968_RclHR1_01960027 [Rhizophagus clarus]